MLKDCTYFHLFYFTLDDVLNNLIPVNFKPYEGTDLFTLINNYPTEGNVIPTSKIETFDSALLMELSSNIYLRYSKFYTFNYINENVTEIRSSSRLTDWKRRFISLLIGTYEKYETLYSMYKNNKDKLLDRVKTITKGASRFNDTPQDTGLFEDDPHTTNITQQAAESETDVMPLMERIKEIQNNIRDIIDDWTKEFRALFIHPNNI